MCSVVPRHSPLLLAGLYAGVIALGACSPGTISEPATRTPGSESASTAPPTAGTSDGRPSAEGRAAHTMTPLSDGSLLVAGGCVVDGCAVATESVVRLTAGGDQIAASMTDARDAHTATRLRDGRVLVTGGFSGEGQPPLRSAEIYDPRDDAWAHVGDLTVGRGGHTAELLGDGRVLVAGGWVGSDTYTPTTEVFDPATGAFTRGPDLPLAVLGLSSAPLRDGSVLLVGGQVSADQATRLAVRVDESLAMHRLPGLRQGRFKHAIVTLGDGRVVVIGGTSDDRHLLRSTEVFDPRTGLFQPGPDLQVGRYKMGVVLLPDERIAVTGGAPGVEVLDLALGASREVPGLHDVASFSTLGVLGQTLLVLGGYDEEIVLTHTRWELPLQNL